MQRTRKFLRQHKLSNHTASRTLTTRELGLTQIGWWCTPDNVAQKATWQLLSRLFSITASLRWLQIVLCCNQNYHIHLSTQHLHKEPNMAYPIAQVTHDLFPMGSERVRIHEDVALPSRLGARRRQKDHHSYTLT